MLVVMSADHVYRFDVMDAVATHRRTGAECTVVTTTVPIGEAADHATVETDDDGRVTGFAYKPDDPEHRDRRDRDLRLRPGGAGRLLEELHRELGAEAGEGDTGLGDYGEHLIPRLVDRGRVFAHPMEGYWKDLGQPHKYVAAHHDVLAGDLGVLGDPDWPILGHQQQRAAARVLDGARVTDSLLSPGATSAGPSSAACWDRGWSSSRARWCATASSSRTPVSRRERGWTGRSSTGTASSGPARRSAPRTPTRRTPTRSCWSVAGRGSGEGSRCPGAPGWSRARRRDLHQAVERLLEIDPQVVDVLDAHTRAGPARPGSSAARRSSGAGARTSTPRRRATSRTPTAGSAAGSRSAAAAPPATTIDTMPPKPG